MPQKRLIFVPPVHKEGLNACFHVIVHFVIVAQINALTILSVFKITNRFQHYTQTKCPLLNIELHALQVKFSRLSTYRYFNASKNIPNQFKYLYLKVLVTAIAKPLVG